jgi:hypothetical protein
VAKVAYIDRRFTPATEHIINLANGVIDDYRGQGYKLTVRQLYYRFIAQDLLPESWRDKDLDTKNVQKNYKRLASILNDGRMAGLIDWDAIEDRGRNLYGINTYTDPGQAIGAARRRYHLDRWEGQDFRLECWVEKQALETIVAQACNPYHVNYMACKGYLSQSEMREAAMRFNRYMDDGQTVVLLHLGDHDPSGIDMTRDNDDRLSLFMGGVEVKRLALNYDQVEQYDPPPSPAKDTDSRSAVYVAQFGDDTWELDALEPRVLVDLIQGTIRSYINFDEWQERELEEADDKELLKQAWLRWNDVEAFLNGKDEEE